MAPSREGGGWQSPHSRGRGSVKRVNGRKALWTASGKQEARTRVRVIVIATMVFTHSKMKMSHAGLASAAIGTSDLTSLSTLWSDHRYHTIFFVPDLFCAADYKHVTYGTTQCLERSLLSSAAFCCSSLPFLSQRSIAETVPLHLGTSASAPAAVCCSKTWPCSRICGCSHRRMPKPLPSPRDDRPRSASALASVLGARARLRAAGPAQASSGPGLAPWPL